MLFKTHLFACARAFKAGGACTIFFFCLLVDSAVCYENMRQNHCHFGPLNSSLLRSWTFEHVVLQLIDRDVWLYVSILLIRTKSRLDLMAQRRNAYVRQPECLGKIVATGTVHNVCSMQCDDNVVCTQHNVCPNKLIRRKLMAVANSIRLLGNWTTVKMFSRRTHSKQIFSAYIFEMRL